MNNDKRFEKRPNMEMTRQEIKITFRKKLRAGLTWGILAAVRSKYFIFLFPTEKSND
jgi:hypothetical protein